MNSDVASLQTRWPRTLCILAIVVSTFAFIAYASSPGPIVLTVTCPSTATPVQVGSPTTHGHTFVFEGFKGNRTTNTGTVWIQFVAANDSPGTPLYPGQIISFSSGRAYDASDFWIDAETANDGAVVLVQDRP